MDYHIFINLKIFFYEKTFPILRLIFPKFQELFEESLHENIKSNQQVFITLYNIYYTLIHIAGGKINQINITLSNNYGEALLRAINNSLSYCLSRMYDSQIDSNSFNCNINIKYKSKKTEIKNF